MAFVVTPQNAVFVRLVIFQGPKELVPMLLPGNKMMILAKFLINVTAMANAEAFLVQNVHKIPIVYPDIVWIMCAVMLPPAANVRLAILTVAVPVLLLIPARTMIPAMIKTKDAMAMVAANLFKLKFVTMIIMPACQVIVQITIVVMRRALLPIVAVPEL